MAAVLTPPSTPPLQNGNAENKGSQNNANEADEPLTVDAFVRLRAQQMGKEPIVSYPSSGIDYVDYSPQQLNVFACHAAKHYASAIPPRASSDAPEIVVAILGPSSLEYLITLLALTKMGHTVLFLSTRLSSVAYTSLLKTTGAKHLLVDDAFHKMATSISAECSVDVNCIINQEMFEKSPASDIADTTLAANLDPHVENGKIAWIIHSSGTTGVPKPIFQTHRAALKNYTNNMNMVGFVTLPLFHAHGLSCLFRALNARKKIMLYNASLPLTHEHLLGVLREHSDIEIFYGVPYALKILAETPEGISALAKLKAVMSGGSACPDGLGDRLVANGVNVVSHFGTTETGQLLTSSRPAGDREWNYLRAMPDVRPYLRWEPQSEGIYELVVLDGLKSKVASNRPDGAFATKDLFAPHPTIPNAWKYYARLDDTITLVNGEKAVPNLFEAEIRTNPNVSEAIIFGAGKQQLGMMIVPSPVTEGFGKDVILGSILPSLEKANKSAPAYAQISTVMIKILPTSTELPKTDKGTVIRARFYKEFEEQIDAVYEATELVSGDLALSEEDLRAWIHKELADLLNIEEQDLDDKADFFSFGVDSLRAIQLRSVIVKNIDIGGHKLGSNIAFDYPTVGALAKRLYQLRSGTTVATVLVEEQMKALIDKYGSFKRPAPHFNSLAGEYVVVTGATGSLGAHVVAQLAVKDEVNKIYCLVRASSATTAHQRITDSLQERNVYDGLPVSARQKIVALTSNLASQDLGLGQELYSQVTCEITSLIHCAWSVNFNLGLASFEKDCIAGAHNLINLCLSAKRRAPASFNFCSSVSAVAATPSRVATEAVPAEVSYAQGMGYAQSKLVTEHICDQAAEQTGIRARVLRVGQVIGDTKSGIWNATEAIPMIFQSAITIKAVPRLDEEPLWLPVDIVAKAIIEMSLSNAGAAVMNVVNHQAFHWTRDLLPMVRKALAGNPPYEEVGRREWVAKLRESNPDPVKNPPIKLLSFFEGKYDRDEVKTDMSYETDKARGYSQALADAPIIDEQLIEKFVKYWQATAWKTVR